METDIILAANTNINNICKFHIDKLYNKQIIALAYSVGIYSHEPSSLFHRRSVSMMKH